MRKLLQIGEVAQLLGVTTKTIRHYHKISLLQEPERTEAGYRLYNSLDLLHLKRIRNLQSLGLPLKNIKVLLGVLGEQPSQQRPLREVLQALDEELAGQVLALEERRARIQTLLADEAFEQIDSAVASPSFERAKDLLGEQLAALPQEALELEMRLWANFDDYQWPVELREQMLHMTHYFTLHPQLYEQLIAFSAQLMALADLPEDAPEVERLVELCMRNNTLPTLMKEITTLSKDFLQMESPFSDVLDDLMSMHFSPAQKRFFAELSQRKSN